MEDATEREGGPFAWRTALLLALGTAALLVPFLGRPFHVDDPLFVWTAQHIAGDPLDPFGFHLNWNGYSQTMHRVSQNPVLGSYLLVPFGAPFGWNEVALHIGGLVWAVLLTLGTYTLACRMTTRPAVATLVSLLSPVVLLSSTTVMCDVPMLVFWVWAIVFFRRGVDEGRLASLVLAGACATLAVLTKYSALGIVPLFLVDAVLRKRRPGWWLVALAMPIAGLVLHELWTAGLYGKGHFQGTRDVQQSVLTQSSSARAFTAVTFAGGCLAPILFLAPAVWKRAKGLAIGVGAVLCIVAAVVGRGALQDVLGLSAELPPLLAAQIGLWFAGGAVVIALPFVSMASPAKERSNDVLLALWVLGVLGTAAFVKWWVDGRGILPAAPALGILLARGLDRRAASKAASLPRLVPVGLAVSLVLGLVAAWAELGHARSNRAAAEDMAARFLDRPGELRFQGHWGFQYYLERAGGKPWNYRSPQLTTGDFVVMPRNNSFVLSVPGGVVEKREVLTYPVAMWVTTMNPGAAGFHAASWGPVPFAFGPVPWPEEYLVVEATGSMGF